jgi:hypothetical protein
MKLVHSIGSIASALRPGGGPQPRGAPAGLARGQAAANAPPLLHSGAAAAESLSAAEVAAAQARALANRAAEALQGTDRSVRIEPQDGGQFVLKILDSESGELITQFPPESVVALSDRIEELRGMLFASEA